MIHSLLIVAAVCEITSQAAGQHRPVELWLRALGHCGIRVSAVLFSALLMLVG